jgi:hypothetical protein
LVLKSIFAAVIGAALLVSSNLSMADGYKPDEFLGLDLSKAALSSKPLGPPSQFQLVGVEAKAGSQRRHVHAGAQPKPAAKIRVAHVRAPYGGAARTRLAHRHSNPLDAQAFDTRIQVWPCRSGGICNWQR